MTLQAAGTSLRFTGASGAAQQAPAAPDAAAMKSYRGGVPAFACGSELGCFAGELSSALATIVCLIQQFTMTRMCRLEQG